MSFAGRTFQHLVQITPQPPSAARTGQPAPGLRAR